jgi:glycine oxidase
LLLEGKDSSEVVVVGGGAIGCAVAYFLSRAGVRTTVLDRGRIGMEASNAAAGMLAPLAEAHGVGPMLDLFLASLGMFPALAPELQEATGIDLEYRLSGILRVAFSDEEADELRQRLEWQQHLGFPLEWLDETMLWEVEPRLSPRVVGGLFSEEEGQVSNQNLTLALSRAAAECGANIREHTPVTSLVLRNGRASGVRTPEGRISAGHVVLAAGAWTGRLAHRLGLRVPVRPVRGQMLALGGMVTPIRSIIWSPRGYLVPRANGLVFAGATVEDVGFRPQTTVRGLREMRRAAIEMVPQLALAQAEFTWAGLRPGSADDLPILGPLPGLENVTVASGHYRNGILLAPITGRLIAQAIIEGRPSEALTPFSPARFC